MSTKPIVYSQEQGRSFDVLSGWNDYVSAVSLLASDLFTGGAGASSFPTLLAGLTATVSAGLTFSLAPGSIYAVAALDANNYGSLSANLALVIQQGSSVMQNVTLSVSGIPTGGSQWALVEGQFVQLDTIRGNDPTSGVLPYYNTSSPTQPLQGPLNNFGTQNTVRSGIISFRVLYGSGVTGAPSPPAPDSGFLPIYYILLSAGQSTLLQSNIYTSGVSTNSAVISGALAPFTYGMSRSYYRQNTTTGTTGTSATQTLSSFTLNGGLFALNSRLRIRAYGTFNNTTASSATILFTLNVAGSVLFTSPSLTVATSAGGTSTAWDWEVIISNQNSLTTQYSTTTFRTTTNGNSGGTDTMVVANEYMATNSSSINTANNQQVLLTATLGTVAAGLGVLLQSLNVELIP